MTDETPLPNPTAETLAPDLMDLVLQVLRQAGGVAYMARQAEENPRAFLTLLGRVLPLQQRARPPEPLVVEIRDFTAEEILGPGHADLP